MINYSKDVTKRFVVEVNSENLSYQLTEENIVEFITALVKLKDENALKNENVLSPNEVIQESAESTLLQLFREDERKILTSLISKFMLSSNPTYKLTRGDWSY